LKTHDEKAKKLLNLLGFKSSTEEDQPEDYHLEFALSRAIRHPITEEYLYPKFSMILREVLRKKFRHRQVERAVQISPSSVLGNRRSGRGSRSSKQCKHAIFCFTFMHAKKAYELMRGEWPFRLSGVRQF
jgi:hypothetical protein